MNVIVVSMAFGIMSRAVLAQGVPEPAAPPPASDAWVVSETTSPVDYSPIVTATASSRETAASALTQLSILCRGGRTEMVVAGPALSAGGTDYELSYRLNNGQPVRLSAARTPSGTGVAFRGDVVSLLQSLPDEGALAIRLAARSGAAHEGQFSLTGLKRARGRVAAACNWPPGKPRTE